MQTATPCTNITETLVQVNDNERAEVKQTATAILKCYFTDPPEPPEWCPPSPACFVKRIVQSGKVKTVFMDVRPHLRAAKYTLTPKALSAVAVTPDELRGRVRDVQPFVRKCKLRHP